MEAIPNGHVESPPADVLDNKILISASNYYPQRDGEIDFDGQTQTERVAALLPPTRVVKAYNTIYWEHLPDQGDPSLQMDDRRVIPLDVGPLRDSHSMEPGPPPYNNSLTQAQAQVLLEETTA